MAPPCPRPKMKGPHLSVIPSGEPHSTQSEHERHKMIWEKEVGHRSLPIQTQKTAVLLLSWTPGHDDLEVGPEVDRLHAVFEDVYGFTVYKKLLDPKKPQQQALKDLSAFVYDEDAERALLIIYYAGHGHGANVKSGDMRLEGQKAPNEILDEKQSIVWSKVESAISATDADVLLIFDCCNAGLLALPIRGRAKPRSSYQFLGACSEDQTTWGPSDKSFTTALIWALKKLARKNKAFNTADLREKIMRYEHFPRRQVPVLSDRRPPHEHIVISKQKADSDEAASARSPSPSDSDELEPSGELEPIVLKDHVDLRFHFEHKVDEEHFKEAARAVYRLNRMSVPWSRVTFLEKSSILEKYANLWMGRGRGRSGSKDSRLLTPVEGSGILAEAFCVSPVAEGGLKVPGTSLLPATFIQQPEVGREHSYGNGRVVSPRRSQSRKRRVEDESILFHVGAIVTKIAMMASEALSWISRKLNSCSDYERIPDEESL